MSRYAAPQPAPPEPTSEGDSYFDRVNMKLDRATLPPGTLALSVNKRLRTKKAATRDGIWPPVFANILALTVIRGWGVYSNPAGDEVLLVAGNANVYIMRDGSYPTTLPVEGPLATSVEFVQAGNKIYIFQGPGKLQLVWDGVSPSGFTRITKSHPDDTSTELIPPVVTAEHAANRLLLIRDKSSIINTDIADYTSYDPILEVFYVNSGASDTIVRAFNYAKGIAIIFGARKVNLLLNYTGPDPSLATEELLHSQLGLAGRKAVVMVGGDVLFLSEPGGIHRISQSFESRQQVVPLPVSDPIQPLIDRINWRAATGAVAAAVGQEVRFAVPIDGSTVNNCLIVYNSSTGLIEGFDTFPAGFQIDDLVVTFYGGERRILALDKAAPAIYVLDEGKSDFIYHAPSGGDELDTPSHQEFEIADLIETRGYATLGWNAEPRRDFKKVAIVAETWAPSLMVTELMESESDKRPLNVTPITKSRTEYDVFLKPDFDPTNVNEDWDSAGRQDYSMVADDDGFVPGETGIDFDRKQRSTLRFSTKARGSHVSYRIAGSQGQTDVCSVLMESSSATREPRRAG